MQIDIWVLRDESMASVDVTGYHVEALDGRIGTVDEAIDDVVAYEQHGALWTSGELRIAG